MNSADYERIGKQVRRTDPELWNVENTDEEVGVLAVKYGYWPPKLAKGLAPEPSIVFTGHAAVRRENQNREMRSNLELDAQRQSYQTNLKIAELTSIEALDRLPTRLAEGELHAEAAHDAIMDAHDTLTTQQNAARKLVQFASQNNMDLPTVNIWRLAQETSKTKIEEDRELKTIEREHHDQMKEIDFVYIAKETNLKLDAAIEFSLREKQVIIALQNQLLQQLEKAHAIQISNDDPSLKKEKLELLKEVTNGFRGQLRGLLQSPKREDAGGSNPPAQLGGDDTEDRTAGYVEFSDT